MAYSLLKGQSVCQDPQFAQGGFNLSSSDICLPNAVNITNTSAAQNIKYVYDYQYQAIDEIEDIATSSSTYLYPQFVQAKTYTILQIGDLNGQKSIACKEIIVRPNNTPVYSYTVCGANVFEVVIPQHSINNFDYYVVELGSGQTPVTLQSTALPYSFKANLSLPRTIRVMGHYNDPSKNCTGSTPYQTIPANIPSLSGTPRPHAPKINLLTMENLSDVRIEYTGPYTNDPLNSVKLYRYLQNNYGGKEEIIGQIISNVYYDKLPDTNSVYCYIAERKAICGGIIPERSAEVCINPLRQVNFLVNPKRYDLRWPLYNQRLNGFSNSLFSIFLGVAFNSTQILTRKEEDGNVINLPRPVTSFNYFDQNIDCKKRYCYRVEFRRTGILDFNQFDFKSVSNRVCVDRKDLVAPAVTEAFVSTNASNENQVFIKKPTSWPFEINRWILHNWDGNDFVKIDSSLGNNLVVSHRQTVSKSEKYKVSYIDECETPSEISETMHSIFLELDGENRVKWSKESPYIGRNLVNYEVYYLDETTEAFTGSQSFDKSEFSGSVKLDNFEETGKVHLITGNDKTFPDISRSNILRFPIPSSLFFPTAFSPNGDTQNPLLEIKGKTRRISDINIKIYNRLGQQVAEFTSLSDTWDGKFNGLDLPAGEYNYVLNAATNNGTIIRRIGSIVLLR
jgi:gliding motility-associated-like protein